MARNFPRACLAAPSRQRQCSGNHGRAAGKEVRRGKAPALPPQPPLISARDKIPGERELGSGQAQLLLSAWVGEESLGTIKQLESKSLKFLQKSFAWEPAQRSCGSREMPSPTPSARAALGSCPPETTLVSQDTYTCREWCLHGFLWLFLCHLQPTRPPGESCLLSWACLAQDRASRRCHL